jgi:chromosomal replication initiation ATPase DnaA
MTAAERQPPPQLVFDLPHRQARGMEDFLLSDANAAAMEFVDRWPRWVSPAAVVAGPAGAGKTHLAHVWANRSGAPLMAASELSDAAIEVLAANSALVVEDIDRRRSITGCCFICST